MKKYKFTKIFAFTLALAMLTASVAVMPVSAGIKPDPLGPRSFPGYFWLNLTYDSMSLDYDALGEGNNVYYNPNNPDCLGGMWYIKQESNGYYSIRSGSCMDAAISVENDSSANGAKIVIKKYTASSGQQWQLDFKSYSGYRILSRCSYFEKGITISSRDTKSELILTDSPDYLIFYEVTNADHSHFFKNGECTECFKLLGDLDDDGAVTAEDGALLSRYLAKWDGLLLNLSVADLNHDGIVDSKDKILLDRYLAGWNLDLDSK